MESSEVSGFGISLRIDLPGGVRFGPGKAALLQAIGETGSISAAARELSMSYPKASRLVSEINVALAEPAVATRHGGADKGGAELTESGRKLVGIYNSVHNRALEGFRGERDAMLALLAM